MCSCLGMLLSLCSTNSSNSLSNNHLKHSTCILEVQLAQDHYKCDISKLDSAAQRHASPFMCAAEGFVCSSMHQTPMPTNNVKQRLESYQQASACIAEETAGCLPWTSSFALSIQAEAGVHMLLVHASVVGKNGLKPRAQATPISEAGAGVAVKVVSYERCHPE